MENIIPEKEDEVTAAAFTLWLRQSRPGERFVYHTGHLASDREEVRLIPGLGWARVYFEPMHTVATTAWIAYERGLVSLVQKKRPDGRFDYIAFKRKDTRRLTSGKTFHSFDGR